jgi:hypothetical protein
MRGFPVTAAASPAKMFPLTAPAVRSHGPRTFYKTLTGVIFIESAQIVVLYFTEFPFVVNVKITWVNASVGFDNELALAGTEKAAHLSGGAHHHSDKVVKIPDADFPAPHKICLPFFEETFQERSITLRRQGVAVRTAFVTPWIDAGHKLKKVEIVGFKKLI